jgi:hypothetical protein
MSDMRSEAGGEDGSSTPLEDQKEKIDWSDPDAKRDYLRKWREANPDYQKEYYKKLKAENPEKLNARAKLYYSNNRDRQRQWRMKKKYGMEKEEFDRYLLEQGGRCAVCQGQDKLCVDHDHETLDVRGLLCGNCNTGIGMLGDSIDGLERALKYMRQWQSKRRRQYG